MSVNTIGDFIRQNMPTSLNRDGEIFRALLADKDCEDGTLEKIFQDVKATIQSWTEKKSAYELEGEALTRFFDLFSVLKKQQNETELSFLEKNKLIFQRVDESVWGTTWEILHTFKRYFGIDSVWLVNNAVSYDENLLINGNFERVGGWTLFDGATYSQKARFEESTGVLLVGGGKIFQSVFVEYDKTYFFHFFLNGKIRVKITDNNGRFWSASSGEFGEWVNAETTKEFTSLNAWDSRSMFFLTDNTVHNVTIEFIGVSGITTYLDYVLLHEKTIASTYSLIAVFEGKYTDETASLAPYDEDPVKATNYDDMGYFAQGEADMNNEYESAEFFDDTAIEDSVSPSLFGGNEDCEIIEDNYDEMSYNDESVPLAPDKEYSESIDYDAMTYFDDSFVYGATGKDSKKVYQNLLNILSPAGIIGNLELLTREENS